MINTPNFNGTNNCQINAGIGFTHADLQLAVSPIKNIGLMCNSYLSNRGHNIDLSIGYYKNNFLNSSFGFDVFAGLGGGNRVYHSKTFLDDLSSIGNNDYTFESLFDKYTSQISVYKTLNEKHQLSATFRASYLDYKKFSYSIIHYNDGSNKPDPIESIYVTNNSLTVTNFDFAFTYKYRAGWFGYFVQPAIYYNNGPENSSKNVYFNRPLYSVLNAGITFYIGKNQHE